MEISQEQREAYVASIRVLFNHTIQVSEEEINEEVIEMVDAIFLEITDCHLILAPAAAMLEIVGNVLHKSIPDPIRVLIGDKSLKDYLSDKSERGVAKVMKIAKEYQAWQFYKDLQATWLKYSSKNRKLQVCINTARRNWRTKVQEALWGY